MKTSVLAQILLAGAALAIPQMERRQDSASATASPTLAKRATTILATAGGEAIADSSVGAALAGGSSKGIASTSISKRRKRSMANANMVNNADMMANADMMNDADMMDNADMMANADMMNNADSMAKRSMANANMMNDADMMAKTDMMNNADSMANANMMNNADSIANADMMAGTPVERRQTFTASAEAAATATVGPEKASSGATGKAAGKASSRMAAIPNQAGVMRTASGAMMNALRNDVDLQAFSEMVETVKTHAATFDDVLRTYAQQAEAAQGLEGATQAIDHNQLLTDVAAPLNLINSALYDGISRMSMASEYRPSRGGIDGLTNVAGSYSLVSELLAVIVALVSNLGTTDILGGSTGTSGNIVSSVLSLLLGGLLGGSGGLLGGLLGGGGSAATDPVTDTLNSILGLVNGLVPITGVTDLLNIGL